MKFIQIEDDVPEFWEGNQNILIRLWTYAKAGMNLVNDYKYIGAAIFGLYYTLKLNNLVWLALMFLVSIPILVSLGRWWLYKGAKTSEFVTNQKGTVLGYQAYNTSVEQVKLLEDILKALKNKNEYANNPKKTV